MKRLDAILLANLLLNGDSTFDSARKEELNDALTEVLDERSYWTISPVRLQNWRTAVSHKLSVKCPYFKYRQGSNKTKLTRLIRSTLSTKFNSNQNLPASVQAAAAYVVGLIFEGRLEVGSQTLSVRDGVNESVWVLLALVQAPLRKFAYTDQRFIDALEKQANKVLRFSEKQLEMYVRENLALGSDVNMLTF